MRMCGVVLALAGGAYLGLTAARDLQPFDSSEFVLNAIEVGVGHPPGQPGYVLAAALWTRLLPVAPAAALSWLSAAATVLAALLALRLARRLSPGRSSWADAAALAAVWLVPGVWDLGTRPEVYAPAAA